MRFSEENVHFQVRTFGVLPSQDFSCYVDFYTWQQPKSLQIRSEQLPRRMERTTASAEMEGILRNQYGDRKKFQYITCTLVV